MYNNNKKLILLLNSLLLLSSFAGCIHFIHNKIFKKIVVFLKIISQFSWEVREERIHQQTGQQHAGGFVPAPFNVLSFH